jgi:RNA polymerase sigma-70 factor, ECF subfamily
MEDHIAIRRLKQGDLSGLEHLVNRYQVQAVHAAYMICYDRALAEDVAQTAFVKVAEHIRQFDEEQPFEPWFFRIIMNDAIKLAKKKKRNFSLEEKMDEATSKLAEWLTDPMPKPEQLVEQKESGQIILKAIHSLPPGQRAVITMRYFLNMNEADMSLKMDRPLSTIKWWLRAARKRLSELIAHDRS